MKHFRRWFLPRTLHATSETAQNSGQEQTGLVSRLSRQGASLHPKLRTLLFGTVVAASIGVSAESVHASPGCQRLIHTYKEKLLPNRVSKTTAARWAIWNKSHPNFHPKLRPRYIMTKEETSKHLDFACEVDLATVPLNPFLVPGEPTLVSPLVKVRASAFSPAAPFLPPSTPGLFLSAGVAPLPLFPAPFLPASGGSWQAPPVGSPLIPPTEVAPVPEPSSLILLGTGLLLILWQRKTLSTKMGAVIKTR